MLARHRRPLAVLATAAGLLAAAASAQDPPESKKAQAPEDINKTFEDPDLNSQEYIDRFERESREVFAHREAIAEVVGLEPGMEVADVGAGTGLFTLLFAERVRPDGKVYAVDIAPAFLELILKRAEEKGLGDVVATVRGGQDATNLEPRSVDAVFICDTYHHFEDPRAMLRSIRRALRPGGTLVVVEFDKEKANSDFVAKHVRATREVFLGEITGAGFEPVEVESAPELNENFIAVFRKAPMARGELIQKPSHPARPAEGRP